MERITEIEQLIKKIPFGEWNYMRAHQEESESIWTSKNKLIIYIYPLINKIKIQESLNPPITITYLNAPQFFSQVMMWREEENRKKALKLLQEIFA